MSLSDCLKTELMSAMRARDAAVIAALRSALSALANAEAVPVTDETNRPGAASSHFAGAAHGLGAAEQARLPVGEDQQRAILREGVADLAQHAAQLERIGEHDQLDGTRRALRVLIAILAESG